ncbi:hypothetical protein [Bacillus sp. AFS031507]|uniref:hypothetical protein n=1 Tax=Bacillus sp. AFS031507 TaxID=2033496 RepID=UPI000BFBF2E0|nr:hypothetical protein [Bacillus sp. AFS031507]PGY06408.1 hypothetical protein COE25_27680 [Bacillus sp. AFS031507]
MKILFDETFTSNDGKPRSRNIWYGNADVSVDGEYGKSIKLTEDFMDNLCEIIKNDLSKNAANAPTETNWYFYGGSTVTQDILPTIMVRERSNEFITNFNISDHDFAVNIDAILLFKADFEKRLASH